MDKLGALKQFFGHTAFRGGQEALIDGVLSGRDAFGIMPTGGGKSLCYQIPALLLPGTALVISPLISLMKDQVMALQNAGVDAAFLNSSLDGEEFRSVCRRARAGEFKLIYVAPERLQGEGFVSLAQSLPISLIAVDEAHCISQWGQDFRPSYLRIVEFLEKLPQRPPLAAFTATATAQVRQDVERILGLRDPVRVLTGFDRPNLYFEVRRPRQKRAALSLLVQQRRDKSGIIYCATRSSVERVCQELQREGVAATRYHAGLSDAERRDNQEDFLYDRCPVMVATNAFGMGIDKSNVSFVIHYNMPKSLEAYYQEAGRAGRDGERADCILLYAPADISTAKFFIQNAGENEALSPEEQEAVLRRDYQRLDAMIGYCKTTDCLRGYILDYFGQSHEEKCGNCGSCKSAYVQQDITSQAQMILSCVKRIHDKLGYAVGASLLVRTLCGGQDKRVRALGLDALSTYALLRTTPRAQVREYVERLEAAGYLRTDPLHGGVELTARAGNVLFRGERVEITVKETLPGGEAPERRKRRRRSESVELPEADASLLSCLKALRSRLAQEEGVPAYIVFSNATLSDMASRMPGSMEELLEVSGVGAKKAARYGAQFLSAIADWREDD